MCIPFHSVVVGEEGSEHIEIRFATSALKIEALKLTLNSFTGSNPCT